MVRRKYEPRKAFEGLHIYPVYRDYAMGVDGSPDAFAKIVEVILEMIERFPKGVRRFRFDDPVYETKRPGWLVVRFDPTIPDDASPEREVDDLVVRWPSGVVQRVGEVAVDGLREVVEEG